MALIADSQCRQLWDFVFHDFHLNLFLNFAFLVLASGPLDCTQVESSLVSGGQQRIPLSSRSGSMNSAGAPQRETLLRGLSQSSQSMYPGVKCSWKYTLSSS